MPSKTFHYSASIWTSFSVGLVQSRQPGMSSRHHPVGWLPLVLLHWILSPWSHSFSFLVDALIGEKWLLQHLPGKVHKRPVYKLIDTKISLFSHSPLTVNKEFQHGSLSQNFEKFAFSRLGCWRQVWCNSDSWPFLRPVVSPSLFLSYTQTHKTLRSAFCPYSCDVSQWWDLVWILRSGPSWGLSKKLTSSSGKCSRLF